MQFYKKPFFWYAAMILAIGILASGIFSIVLKPNQEKPTAWIGSNASPQLSPDTSPQATPAPPRPTAAATLKPSESVLTQTYYKNERLGFSIQFPEDWKDNCIIYEGENGLSFYSKRIHLNYPIIRGWLFSINRRPGELITKEFVEKCYAKATLAAQGSGYSYIAQFPTDVQFPDEEDKELSDEYIKMQNEIKGIYQSITLSEIEPPKASNEGYKFIGSPFFNCEIPQSWEVKTDEKVILTWNLYSDGDKIGSIEMIPYGSEMPAGDESNIREYVLYKYKYGSAKLTLKRNLENEGARVKIKSSFIVNGSPGVLYDLSEANVFLEDGGEKLFGKLQNIEPRPDIPNLLKSVSIRIMKYVPDSSEKGYQIEDTGLVQTFTAENNVKIIPLAAPDYKTYGTYDDPVMLRSAFFEAHKDTLFDFIIFKGVLKFAFERYLP